MIFIVRNYNYDGVNYMRTENISYNPQFTGTLKYINLHAQKNGENLQQILEPRLGKLADELRTMISDKPYDLFIERSQNMRGFYEINANVNYENIVNDNMAKKGRPSVIYEERLERVIPAADEAMKSFENTPDYKKMTRGKGIFRAIWQTIVAKLKG